VTATEAESERAAPDPESRPAGGSTPAHLVLANTPLAPGVHRLDVAAHRIAEIRRPGQFVIVRRAEGAERIPLTIADSDASAGTITLVIQAVGKSTTDLVALEPGEAIRDIAGPLGRATELVAGRAVCVGGGVGTAVLLPIAQGLHRLGASVTSIVGGRSADHVILAAELAAFGEVVVCTDDGSRGRAGLVTDGLADVLARDGDGDAGGVDVVYAVGPVPMMRAVTEMTRSRGLRTIVSLNPIMVDGTGMCGGCRVRIGGDVRFACVDGPEFDGHQVDFDELADRLTMYRAHEQDALTRTGAPACREAR
jgi:ferredoxin--NADP+ reductase